MSLTIGTKYYTKTRKLYITPNGKNKPTVLAEGNKASSVKFLWIFYLGSYFSHDALVIYLYLSLIVEQK